MTSSVQTETNNKNQNPPKHKPPKAVLAILLIAVISGGLFYAWKYFSSENDDKKLKVSGRIEGYETNVGAKIGGRIDFIAAREGDSVKAGQLIVHLTDDDIKAQLAGAEAQLKKSIQLRDQATQQINVLESQVSQARLNSQQALEDTQGRIRQAEAQVSSNKAALAQAQAQLTQSEADLKLADLRNTRYKELAKVGAVQQDQADQAATTLETTGATVASKQAAIDATKKNLIASMGNLEQVRSTRLNPQIRKAELQATESQLIQSKSQLLAASEDVKNAQASVDQIKANIAYLNINSPIDGTVTARTVEPGAVVTPGQTVLSLIDLDTVYLRAYVPEGRIGKLRVGQSANVFLDSAPEKALEGKIIAVDPKASFTPENIYFKDDRVRQVFGIKIAIKDPQRFPKPGMPADAEILLDEAK